MLKGSTPVIPRAIARVFLEQQEKEHKENAVWEEAAVDEFLMPGEDDTSEEKPNSGELLKAASTQGGLTYMNRINTALMTP